MLLRSNVVCSSNDQWSRRYFGYSVSQVFTQFLRNSLKGILFLYFCAEAAEVQHSIRECGTIGYSTDTGIRYMCSTSGWKWNYLTTMRTHLSAVHLHTIHIINLTTSQMLLHFQHFHLSSHLLSMPWFFSRCLFSSVFNYFLDASVT